MSQEMKSSKSPKIINDEIELPQPMIQHIQSFLTRKEAARTTILSKSWYDAWLTRPTFDFDQHDFNNLEDELPNIRFAEVTTKNMERYEESNLKIDNFKLCLAGDVNLGTMKLETLFNKLILSALKRGATELDLHLHSAAFVLPREVLESEDLARLSLSKRAIDGNVRCWRLKSLILHRVHLARDDMISDILSCCLSIEELSISFCTRPSLGIRNRKGRPKMIDLSGMNVFELHKLRRLFLEKLWFDPSFFSNFGSRFPCLKDLSAFGCFYSWSEPIKIASISLESLSFVKVTTLAAEFHVPNLVSFRYSGEGIPSLNIESSREWESDVSILSFRFVHTHSSSWYLRLKKLLTQLRPSKISLSISRELSTYGDHREIKAAVSKPALVVENLTIDPQCRLGYTILSGLLSVCRPKFLTFYWLPHNPGYPENESLVNNLCKRLIEEIITPDCEISDKNMFGQLGLKEASVEVFEEKLEDVWQPLLLNEPLHSLTTPEIKRKFRFQLRWG